MIIDRNALNDWMDRELDSFEWMKTLTKRELYRHIKALPGSPRFKTLPWRHQLVCFYIGACLDRFLFLLDMGLGKTKICSDLITQSYLEARTQRALVFVPRVINMVSWANDLARHSTLEPWMIDVENIEAKWQRLSEPQGDLTIVDFHGAMLACTKKGAKGGKRQIDEAKVNKLRKLYDFIAVDEIHMLGNADSLWTRLVSRLTDTATQAYGFTGTLFGKDPGRLFSQFHVVDRGETLGEDMGMFRGNFFTQEDNGFAREWKFRKRYARDLNRILQHRSIAYDMEDVDELDMPPDRDPIVMQLEFGSEQRQYYLRALEKLIDMQDGSAIDLEAPWTRMRQILSGYVEWRDGDGVHHVRFKDNPKLKALEYLVSSLVDKKMIVAHHFVETGRLITEELDRLKVPYVWLHGGAKDKAGLLQRFIKDPSCRVFVMNSDSGGTGTDGLQHVAHYMVMYETPSAPDKRKQLMRRIRRPGQRRQCIFYDLTIRNSLDSGILRDIAEGNDLFSMIMSRQCVARKLQGCA